MRTDVDGDGKLSDDGAFDQIPPPYGATFSSGVRVAAGDTDHSGALVEVITAPGANVGSKPVKIYDDDADPGALLSDNPLDDQFTAFPGKSRAFVAFARSRRRLQRRHGHTTLIPDDGDPATRSVP